MTSLSNMATYLMQADFEKLQTSKSCGVCKVCGAPAGKHNYYGARCCISCRGFFPPIRPKQPLQVFRLQSAKLLRRRHQNTEKLQEM